MKKAWDSFEKKKVNAEEAMGLSFLQ